MSNNPDKASSVAVVGAQEPPFIGPLPIGHGAGQAQAWADAANRLKGTTR